MKTKTTQLKLAGDVEIDLIQGGRGEFVGLGGVRVGGVKLRNPSRPWTVRTDTPEGILYARFELVRVRRSKGGIELDLRAEGTNWGRTEYHDEYNQQMVELEHDTEPVTDDLVLHLAPAHMKLGGRDWVGFSYSFEFRSRQREIHRLWTEGTWEIGGSVVGNTVLHQGEVCMPVYRGARNTMFTTHCLKTLHTYGSPQGSSFQLGARGGLLQAFDFQYARQGVLLQFWPRLESISSLVESPPGSELLHVVDEYRFEMTKRVRTTPKLVLFSAGAAAEHETRNLWLAAYEYVNGKVRSRFGVEPTVVEPEVHVGWKKSRLKGDRFFTSVMGMPTESHDLARVIADRMVPRLAEQGIKRFFVRPMSDSDVTAIGMRRKLDRGVDGDLHCASVCATHRFLPSKFWGGMKAWRYMYEKAQKHGIEVGVWFAPHFSPRAPIYRKHPEYRMLEVNSHAAGGGYGFKTLVTGDWNTGLYESVLEDLRRWKTEGGFDYFFVDSWPNLGLLGVNYAARMRTNFRRLCQFFHDVQKIGIKTLTFEGISPLGVSHFGVKDLKGARLEQDSSVAGQNDLDWWIGNEDMAIDLCFMVKPVRRTQGELREIEFRAMANRSFIEWQNQYGTNYVLPAWWVRLNKIYNQAVPNMKSRTVLPDGAGISWTDGKTQVLWLYRDGAVKPASGSAVERFEADGLVRLMGDEAARLSAWQVYRIVR